MAYAGLRVNSHVRLTARLYGTMHFKVLVYWNFVCSYTLRVGFVYEFISWKPAVMHINNQGLTNLYGSIMFFIQRPLALFFGPL